MHRSELVPHGLWPAYKEADNHGFTFPAFCTGETTRPDGTFNRSDHEWRKHGTCTGLPREHYEHHERALMSSQPHIAAHDVLQDHAGTHVDVTEIHKAFGGEQFVALKTDPHCRLEELTTCWEKLPNGAVGSAVQCPTHVLASTRNSGSRECERVWIDRHGQCQFIDRKLKQVLRTGRDHSEA